MKRFITVCALCIVAAIVISGCKQQARQEAPAPAAQTGPALMGKVAETMNAGGYTYMQLENNGQKIWVAGPQTAVTVGQQVVCQQGMVMRNFTSPTLKRTFESIIFSGGCK